MTRLAYCFVPLAASLLLACGAASPDDSDGEAAAESADATGCTATSKRAIPIEVSITPEAAEAPYVEVLAKAKKSIRVMVYILDEGEILDTLKEKVSAGLTVSIILDHTEQKTNQAAFDALTDLGADVKWSDPEFSFMHAKILVVDGKDAIVSTGNFSKDLLSKERNLVAHDSDPHDVKDLVTLFDADFARKTPHLSCTRLIVSPINSKERILALVNSARSSIEIESMQFADADLRAAVAQKAEDGVKVRVILAASSWIATNTDAAKFLEKSDIPVKYMTAPMVHIKNIIVDGKSTYMGSENLSTTSLTKNREVGIIVTDAAAVRTIASSFESDYAMATAF